MEISQLPYYVKFQFLDEQAVDGGCISTVDINVLDIVRHVNSDRPFYNLSVGDVIYFVPRNEDHYEITGISITHLFTDTDDCRTGVDMEDCAGLQGEYKDFFFKVYMTMRRAN